MRLEESLEIHKREIKNIGTRGEVRQYEFAKLKDLRWVTLVQALRQEIPEWRNETPSDSDIPLQQRTESRNHKS